MICSITNSPQRLQHLVARTQRDTSYTQIVFFIDNVDEYFRPVLEDRSQAASGLHSLYRNRNNEVWSLAQIALASVAYELEKTNHHIKIFCTMRHEAFLKMPDVEVMLFKFQVGVAKIEYTR